ncbi:hypothetical protein LTR78_001641 [Recurvomyces mirabilis]|uniref:SH3 domain-containing protein n=1 Tax=Recurvomyces mirabilis TaxID=574656 RepID=A0AAE0WV16_9PEZI|nr:hypothetical protein LTR78_001641 [Recurvomyces mirabilis]KAK5151789.1 hypothetical protein LTS14_008921 [Recurvomyces mirabilis]
MAGMPFKVKAIYEYTSQHDDDLKFPIGQVINVTELEGDDWYVGDYTDASGAKHDGLFPKNFVERYEPEVPSRPARAARPKSMLQQSQPPQAQAVPQPTRGQEDEEQEDVPVVPAASKPQPQPPSVDIPEPSRKDEEVKSPPSATREPVAQATPPAPKPAPAELAATSTAKAGPPPIAPKSNAFKDRIAAFNSAGAAPVAPLGTKAPRNDYIKKPFVAPPPSRNAYIPPVQKVEPVHKPYIRDEDPEIRQREEEDHAAAEAAGLTGDSHGPAAEDEEDAPKPMSLKERMALLQKEQEAARNRHAVEAPRKKPPVKKASESSERSIPPPVPAHEAAEEGEGLERVPTQRKSLDVNRERPRVPSSQRRPADPMSPLPSAPAHEILSGGEEADQSGAGELTEDDTGTIGPGDDEDEKPLPGPRAAAAPLHGADVGNEEDTIENQGDDEEEELDEEEQRKQRLRERMARLAGGQQGGGPFNPFGMPPAAAPAAKKRSTREKHPEEEAAASAPQIPQMLAMPGMGGAMPKVRSPEVEEPDHMSRAGTIPRDVEADDENEEPTPPRRSTTMDRGEAPPVPKDRPVPAAPQERAVHPLPPSDTSRPVPRPPPTESRPVPPPPPAAALTSPGPGSESDDEMSMHAKRSSTEHSGIEPPLPIRTGAPPVPARELPQSPGNKRISAFGNEPSSATSDKRASRVPPPVPGSDIMSPGSPRPPPPPPPTAVPTRTNTDFLAAANEETERGESDYEGDYDTDIASSAPHKDALKGHAREPSDSTTADEMTPVSSPPPLPQQNAPRAVPPPPPQAAPPKSRPSMDTPRAPPPVPPPTGRQTQDDDDEYDPYKYTEASRAPPPQVPGAIPIAAPPIPPDVPSMIHEESSADDMPTPGPAPPPRRSTERAPPPPPAAERAPPMPPVSTQPPPPVQPGISRSATRQSMDTQRQVSGARRSMEQSRPAGDQGQMAHDLDLSQDTQWWTAPQPLPPSLQARNGIDILSESEESQKSRRGGRTTISKDIYILYMDYSQTVITAQYDSKDPSDIQLEQRHEPPPPKPRQDQLEDYWQRFGRRIAEQVGSVGHSKKDSTVSDGTPAALPLESIKAHADALLPIGTRAYGALVYANLANASILQNDEIRPGDIITVRNAKFEGHHGTMRQKYKAEYGTHASGAGHVGVVEEWDGTRRAVRVWEQGREKKGGVRSEKLRLGDLRSGEVRVWRVVGREWVGWAD